MRLLRVALGIVPSFVSVLTYAQSGNCPTGGGLTYVAALFGSQFGDQGSPRAWGTAYLRFDPESGTVTTTLRTAALAGVTGATLRKTGSTAPAFEFDPAALGGRTAFPGALMSAILEDPSSYSLTLSSIDYPTGAMSRRLLPTATLGGTFSGAAVVGTTRALNGGGMFRASIAPNPEGGALLNYTATPTNIGDSLLAIDLWRGAAGSNGRMIAQLAAVSRLSYGSLSGSVGISDRDAASLMTDPGSYYVVARTTEYPTGAVRTQLGLRLNEVFLPVTGSGRGAGGTRWETEVRIFNSSWAPATVAVQRLAGGQSNSAAGGSFSPAQTAVVTIAPRGLATIDTASDPTAGLRDSFGPVVLLSDQPVVATARIYDDARAAGRGTFGATVPGLNRCQSFSRGVLGEVSSGGGAFPVRTNVGLFNPNPVSVSVNLKLAGADGSAISTASLSLRPYEQLQTIATGSGGLFEVSSDLLSGAITFEASGKSTPGKRRSLCSMRFSFPRCRPRCCRNTSSSCATWSPLTSSARRRS